MTRWPCCSQDIDDVAMLFTGGPTPQIARQHLAGGLQASSSTTTATGGVSYRLITGCGKRAALHLARVIERHGVTAPVTLAGKRLR